MGNRFREPEARDWELGAADWGLATIVVVAASPVPTLRVSRSMGTLTDRSDVSLAS